MSFYKKVNSCYIFAQENKFNDLKIALDKDNNWKKYKDPKNNYNVLMIAVSKGHLRCIKAILEHLNNNELIEDRCTNGMSPLLIASWFGYTEIINLLIKYNADINASDSYGNTALMKAARQNHISCVTELLEAGSDTSLFNNHGNTALDMAKSAEMNRLLEIYPKDEVSRLQRENSYNKKNCISKQHDPIKLIHTETTEFVKVEDVNLLIDQICESFNAKEVEIPTQNKVVTLNTSESNDNVTNTKVNEEETIKINISHNQSIDIIDTITTNVVKDEASKATNSSHYYADPHGNFPIVLESSKKKDQKILFGSFQLPWVGSKIENVVIKLNKDNHQGLEDLLYEGSVYEKLGNEGDTGCLKMYYKGPSYLVFERLYIDLANFSTSKLEIKISIFRDILSAVKSLHQYGYMHGDIKPSNILLDYNLEHVKLCDLENARMENELFRHDGNALVCSPDWIAPEVFNSEGKELLASSKIDSFAVGLIGASFLNRKQNHCRSILPSDPLELSVVFSSQANLDAILPPIDDVPYSFFDIIRKLCIIDAKERLSSITANNLVGSTTRVYREHKELTKQNQLLNEGIKRRLDEISEEIGKIIPFIESQFCILKNMVDNINTRVVPTSFILMNKEQTGISQVTSIYQTLMNPGDKIQNQFLSLITNKIYLYLLCEVCWEPQVDYNYPLEIREPKKYAWNILPLAQATLLTIKLLNVGMKLGRCLGFPTPVLQDSLLIESSNFLDLLNPTNLLPYKQLQDIVQPKVNESKNQLDRFCISELEILISKEDPTQMWKRFLTRSNLPNGDFVYCCKNCLNKMGKEIKKEEPAEVINAKEEPAEVINAKEEPPRKPPRKSGTIEQLPTPQELPVAVVNNNDVGVKTNENNSSRRRVKYTPADLARRKSGATTITTIKTDSGQLGTDDNQHNEKVSTINNKSINTKKTTTNNAPTECNSQWTGSATSTSHLDNRKQGIFDCACS